MTAAQHPPEDWPRILYGTAWKGDTTAELTERAIAAGYRGIDTAGQPKHYYEPGVGAGVAAARERLDLRREDLFLQTKFSPLLAQGREVPYDRDAAPAEQVEQSLRRSLANFDTDYLDSYLLHAPQSPQGLTETDLAFWRAMEQAHERGRVRRIGVSNMGVHHIEELLAHARTPPAAVQNRCFARNGWDRDVRAACAQHGIVYQGFSLLTANPHVLRDEIVRELADSRSVTPAQIVFAFAIAVGMLPLTGTTDDGHMGDDLAALDIGLDSDAVEALERIGAP